MKTLLLPVIAAALFLGVALNAHAQPMAIPAMCYPLDEIEDMMLQAGEEIDWIGEGIDQQTDNPLYGMVATNPDTDSWSMLLVSQDKDLGCMIAFGNGSVFRPQDEKSEE